MIHTIVDINRMNPWTLEMARDRKVDAMVHKISEGTFHVDNAAAPRLLEAQSAGLPIGGYHFTDGSDGKAQAEYFLKHISSGIDLGSFLVALDWERSSGKHSPPNATHDIAAAFVETILTELGRKPVVYGSEFPREKVSSTKVDPTFQGCPLWIAEIYTHVKPLPPTWHRMDNGNEVGWTFWQDLDESLLRPGQALPSVIAAGWDWNWYQGDLDDLKSHWPFIFHSTPASVNSMAPDSSDSVGAAVAALDASTARLKALLPTV